MSNRKFLPEDAPFDFVIVYTQVKMPKGRTVETFRIGPDYMEYEQSENVYKTPVRWNFRTNDYFLTKKFLSIVNDAAKLDPAKYPEVKEKNEASTFSYIYLAKRDAHGDHANLWFYEHPLIGADKKLQALLKKISALIPDGWPRPYVLSNLGGQNNE